MDEEIAQASTVHATPELLGIIECRVTANKQVDRATVTRRLTVRRNFKHGDVVGPCFEEEIAAGKMPRTMIHLVPIDLFRSIERSAE